MIHPTSLSFARECRWGQVRFPFQVQVKFTVFLFFRRDDQTLEIVFQIDHVRILPNLQINNREAAGDGAVRKLSFHHRPNCWLDAWRSAMDVPLSGAEFTSRHRPRGGAF